MTRFTDKTIRTDSRWVKITRDNKDRKFTFAVGRKGDFQAHEMQTYKFKWVPNWTEALDKASRLANTY